MKKTSVSPVKGARRTSILPLRHASHVKTHILEREIYGPRCSRAVWRLALLGSNQKKARRLAIHVKNQHRTGVSTNKNVLRVKVRKGAYVGHAAVTRLTGAKNNNNV